MKQSPELNRRGSSQRRKRMWKRAVSALAVIVVFCTVYALVLPAITLADQPICGQQVHEHTDSCYRHELKIFDCAAANHVHNGCEDQLGNPSCGFGEVVLHRHQDHCYDEGDTRMCPLQEQVADAQATADQASGVPAEHVHTPSCYDEEGNRICGLRSGVLHTHDETCWKIIHLDEPELICKLPEHIHVDACYLDPEDLPREKKEFLCDIGAHAHEDGCYDGAGSLICTMPEHLHDVTCKVPDYDPQANVETQADWESTLEGVTLNGHWPEDLLRVAQSQLDYRESKQNVILAEDGAVKGYTRYGAWYGAPYLDWSAAFVSFCAYYAGVEALPQDGSCQGYLDKLEESGLLRQPMSYLPKPGDLVILNTDGSEDGSADAIGIVSELLPGDSGELTTVKFIQGDADGKVGYRTCDLLDRAVLGYGEVPAQPKGLLLCAQDHDHTDACYGCKLFYTDDRLSAQVVLQGIRELPQGLTLTVSPITYANSPAAYSSMAAAVSKEMENSAYYLGDVSFFDMALTLDGVAWVLPQGITPQVAVSFHQPVFTPEAVEEAVKVETFLLKSQEVPAARMLRAAPAASDSAYQVELVQGETYEGAQQGVEGVTFQSNSISPFAVVLPTEIKEGVFWERLFSTDQITEDGTYMIVSAEGNYALRGEKNNNYTQVQIEAQKGEILCSDPQLQTGQKNSIYYTITNANGSALEGNYLKWTFKKSGNGYTVQNQGSSSNYIRFYSESSGWFGSKSYYVVGTGTPTTITLEYKTPENGFRFKNGSNYLRNPGTGAFGYSSENDGQYNNKVPYQYSRDMLIFKLSDITELVIPKDFSEELIEDGEGNKVPQKPDYGQFVVPSGEKTGDTSLSDETGTVKGHYYSDPATSNLEIHYRMDGDLEAQRINDGKVMSDKSVIYGDDDYGAFEHYDPNTFGVTLSTLGQEYMIPQEDMVTTVNIKNPYEQFKESKQLEFVCKMRQLGENSLLSHFCVL